MRALRVTRNGAPGEVLAVEEIEEPTPGLLKHFDEDLSRLHERRMQAWMSERHQSAMGRHVYDPGDFGWSYPALAEEFASYTDRFEITGH